MCGYNIAKEEFTLAIDVEFQNRRVRDREAGYKAAVALHHRSIDWNHFDLGRACGRFSIVPTQLAYVVGWRRARRCDLHAARLACDGESQRGALARR